MKVTNLRKQIHIYTFTACKIYELNLYPHSLNQIRMPHEQKAKTQLECELMLKLEQQLRKEFK